MTDRLVMTQDLNGVPVDIYERTMMIPNPALGMIPTKTAVECFYVHPAPDWPKVRIRARRGIARLLYRLGRRPGISPEIGMFERRFHAAFRVDCEQPDFAQLFLTHELQAFILKKRNVDWSAGAGGIKLFYRGRLRKKRVDPSLDRLRHFIKLIDPELFVIFDESQ